MGKKNVLFKVTLFFLILSILMLMCCACDGSQSNTPTEPAEQEQDSSIMITGDGINKDYTITLDEMKAIPDAEFEHIYSTINNWPSAKKYAVRGIKVRDILESAGVYDSGQVFTFKSDDGYEVTFTRSQLLDIPQYYFPGVEEQDSSNAEKVEPVIAYEYKEGTDTLEEAVSCDLCLIIGQSNCNEHTNPAFVNNISEIIVSNQKAEKWEPATTFPVSGNIAAGELVKLQHSDLGLVKLFYTLDGSTPTKESIMYNPSTYQPELNKPIPIEKDTTIKVLVCGFGKEDSDIAAFEFKVN